MMGDLKKRFFSALIFGPPIILIFYFFPPFPFFVFLFAFLFFALLEVTAITKVKNKILIFILVLLGLASIYHSIYLFFLLLFFSPCLFLFFEALKKREHKEERTKELFTSMTTVVFSDLFLVVPLFSLYLLKEKGRDFVLFLLFSLWASDILAYFLGKNFGKTPLLPFISPKKTYEGLGGAICGTILMAFLFHDVIRLSLPFTFLFGLIFGVLAQAGDFFESLVKRLFFVKDSSSLIPGHGGLLDKFDSFIFSAPFLYLFLSGVR